VLDKPDKFGPQLLAHPTDKPCIDAPSRAPMIAAPAKGTVVPPSCGGVTWSIDGQQHVRIIDRTMPEIATYLASAVMAGGVQTPHSGVDGTGLTGRFDLDLQFMPESAGRGSGPDASGPTFVDAPKKQLGLKLVERRAPEEILVIDHLRSQVRISLCQVVFVF